MVTTLNISGVRVRRPTVLTQSDAPVAGSSSWLLPQEPAGLAWEAEGRPFEDAHSLSGQGHMAPEGSHGVALTGGEQVADLLE
jgi:hypothetical protein